MKIKKIPVPVCLLLLSFLNCTCQNAAKIDTLEFQPGYPGLQDNALEQLQAFPTPRLETDDGNQDISDLHAREDLLLDFYSTAKDGTTRIPISQAMQLIVQRGLPKPANAGQVRPLMVGERPVNVQAPLTDGFARTGYELDTIEARNQKLEFEHAEK